jgi:CRP-like cAMP-binding protein
MIAREFLKSVEVFAGLGEEEAAELASLGREEVFKKGDVVFRERDPGDRLYLVVSGVVEVAKSAPGEKRHVRLVRLERGEVLGEIALFDRGVRSATAVASVVPETRLASWDYVAFQQFLSRRPAAALSVMSAFLRKMGVRLRQTSEAVHILLRALECTGTPK